MAPGGGTIDSDFVGTVLEYNGVLQNYARGALSDAGGL